ncbi:DUF3800 domain-containing protein [Vibrio cyclitrophicus]|uniref:DUF3800 domain-containing protein n=1 Tax=Vibrio cyclitrophicus TaxID=47951 RepID=UPI000C8578E5|nr:DUF3800 domain-containing protein [Vibrio cyclitrophicus]NOH43327.1 DUF3800 domain-containing protein [Vibrio cyclitrophicus]PMJ99571.1 hypothetical protein BCU09_21110 [Vibrio cyclitrophicus]
MEDVFAFADESGTSKGSPCYTIGLVAIPKSYFAEFNKRIEEIYLRSGLQGEIKWEKVRKSAGQINLCIDLIKYTLSSPVSFHAIAVYKPPFRKWHSDEESAFFMTYNYLIRESSKSKNAEITVFADQKSTAYPKQDEVMQIITNHMLAKLPTTSKINHVAMEDSKFHWGLQAVDIITGAVNSSYHLYFDPNAQMQPAKKIAINRMAQVLGWDSLSNDTMPNEDFNIWHFPIETRAMLATKDVVPNFTVSNISREDFDALVALNKPL